MKNILKLENAKFSDNYETKSGKSAIYIGRDDEGYHFVIEGNLTPIVYNSNGYPENQYYRENSSYHIVSKFKEHSDSTKVWNETDGKWYYLEEIPDNF